MKIWPLIFLLHVSVSWSKDSDESAPDLVHKVIREVQKPFVFEANNLQHYDDESKSETTKYTTEGVAPSSSSSSFPVIILNISDTIQNEIVNSAYTLEAVESSSEPISQSSSSDTISSIAAESGEAKFSSVQFTTSEISDYSTEGTPLPTVTDKREEYDFSSLFFDATSDSSPNIPEQATERDDITKLTLQFHLKVINYTLTIQAQQKLIAKLAETVRNLENVVTKLKATNEKESNELIAKNERCRNDFNKLKSELKATRKLIRMEKYSQGLKIKLGEFDVLDKSGVITSRTTVKFSVFEIESDDFSGKILSDRKLSILPPYLGKTLRNISEFSATNVGMIAVNRNAFEGMSQLKVLNLSLNEIVEIESESFSSLGELRKLDLSYNRIEVINKAFKGLMELENLNLSHNKLTALPSDTFDILLNLKVINLSYNQIRELSKETFTDINVIEEFYLMENQIKRINPLNIRYFERSKIIDLRKNPCIDQRFPENLTMIQLVFEIAESCWTKNK